MFGSYSDYDDDDDYSCCYTRRSNYCESLAEERIESEKEYAEYVQELENKLKILSEPYKPTALGPWKKINFSFKYSHLYIGKQREDYETKMNNILNKKHLFKFKDSPNYFIGSIVFKIYGCETWFNNYEDAYKVDRDWSHYTCYFGIFCPSEFNHLFDSLDTDDLYFSEVQSPLVIRKQLPSENDMKICRVCDIPSSSWLSYGCIPPINSIFYLEDNQYSHIKPHTKTNPIFFIPYEPTYKEKYW